MSNDNEQTPQLENTIEARIRRGRATGKHYDGAIVPFARGLKDDSIIAALDGNAKTTVNKLLAAGAMLSYYYYHSSEGEVIQAVIRFDLPNGKKEFRPVRYCGKFPKGHVLMLKALDQPWPPYGLDRLAAQPDAVVLAVEGEKTADATRSLFPNYVVTAWQSGASNARSVELLSLAGRRVILWPDNDLPGRKAMQAFAAAAYEAGASSVSIVDIPPGFPDGWDPADPIPAEVGDDFSLQCLIDAARPVSPEEVAHLIDDKRSKAEQSRLMTNKPGYSRVKPAAVDTALSVLDPDMFGNEWRRVARCLYYTLGEAGLPIFDTWSQGSDKYRAGEPAKLWEEYKKRPNFRADPLAWLFKRAKSILRARAESVETGNPNVELDLEAIKMAAIEELNEEFAVVTRGGKVAVLREVYDPRFHRFTEQYLSRRDFTDLYMRNVELPRDDENQSQKKDKRVRQGDLWFGSPFRRSYEGVHFAPGETLGARYLNTWRGFTVEPTDNPDGWSKLKHHLFDHVARGNQADYDYILNWLAFAVQRLGVPMKTALVLLGPKGSGKSIVTKLFGHLFGHHTFVTSRLDDATGRFNDGLETTILLGLEEAVAPSDRTAEGVLKDLITREELRLEGKFFGIWTAPNHLRIIITSNNEHVVRADASERRYAVFDVAIPFQDDPDARRRYFDEMTQQMESGGYSAMLGELLGRDISDWNPEKIPETVALRRQKEINQLDDPVCSFLFERLTEGYITTGGGHLGSPIHRWSRTEPTTVVTRDLINDFGAYCETHKVKFDGNRFSRVIPRYMPDGFQRKTIRVRGPDGTEPTRVSVFPPLEEVRAHFERVTKLSIDREGEEIASG